MKYTLDKIMELVRSGAEAEGIVDVRGAVDDIRDRLTSIQSGMDTLGAEKRDLADRVQEQSFLLARYRAAEAARKRRGEPTVSETWSSLEDHPMIQNHVNVSRKSIKPLVDLRRRMVEEGVSLLPEERYSSILSELAELYRAKTEEERRDEYGDTLCNLLHYGLDLGFSDPISLALSSAEKVKKRMDYIRERITSKPGDVDHMAEFDRLWDEAKGQK